MDLEPLGDRVIVEADEGEDDDEPPGGVGESGDLP